MVISTPRALARTLAALACSVVLQGGETLFWRQSTQADFEKSTLKNIALRSDGKLSLSPEFREIYDSPSAFLWAVARDSKGNVYTGGGPGAKLLKISPTGEKTVITELPELQIQSIVIDKNDRLFLATSPDGKVYRLGQDGKAVPFYEPKTKYIWSIALNSKGDLFVATGGAGEIHRVTPAGTGSVLFQTEENHVRSMVIDSSDNVIAGTEPGGLVIRVMPDGRGFVLHQMGKREVTALGVGRDGAIYAAAAGNKQSGSTPPPAAPAPTPTVTSTAGAVGQARPPASAPPAFSAPPPAPLTGGSEVVRIEKDGYPRKIWSHSQDIVYALGFDGQGKPLAGTGNKGSIYRLDSELQYSLLTSAPPTQVTAFCLEPNGAVLTATGNSGRVYRLGPGLATEGTVESDVLDAEVFSEWGKLAFDRTGTGGAISITGRSGNLDRPGKTWSPWSPPVTATEGARIQAPSARFFQWKATLTGNGPELNWVELAYLQRNVAPEFERIEATPANFRFPAPLNVTPARTLTLPSMGSRPSESRSSSTSFPTMQFSKGFVGVRWSASDLNGDDLSFKVEIRGPNETQWRLLKENIRERYLTWDSAAYPDGEYRVRVTATDAPSNPTPNALTGQMESDPFLVDNTPPKISALTAARSGSDVLLKWTATDALNVITSAEYSVDGGEWQVVAPAGKLSDARTLQYELNLKSLPAGEHSIAVRVEDEFENQSVEKTVIR